MDPLPEVWELAQNLSTVLVWLAMNWKFFDYDVWYLSHGQQ